MAAAFRGECLSLAAQLEQYAKIDGTLPGVVAAMQESAAALRLAAKLDGDDPERASQDTKLAYTIREGMIETCANIALAIDSGRGNEKEIAKAILALSTTGKPKRCQ